jgi:hypothetical protein
MNGGMAVFSDLEDWGSYVPEGESEKVYWYVIPQDTALFEFQYVEVGAGLPTWTPYHVTMHKYTISYQSQWDSAQHYDSTINIPMTLSVPVDREGKKTVETVLLVAESWWKDAYFGETAPDDPYEAGGIEDLIDATLKFTGWDSVSNRVVEATSKTQILVGHLWDDPDNIGK